MKNRQKIVLEAGEGITFKVSEQAYGTLVIEAQQVARSTETSIVQNTVPSVAQDDVCHNLPTVSAGQYAEELSIYTDKDGNQAVVLPGWTVSRIATENTIWGKDVSLVIYRIPKGFASIDWADHKKVARLQKTYSQLVWVPVRKLTPNGTLDGEYFTEKFGRRNYRKNNFSSKGFNEPLEGGLLAQKESVSKYGGFYMSRYDISKSPEGAPQSVKGCMPWVNINFPEALNVSATFECSDVVRSQLTYGAEYDSILQWLIESGCKTLKEVAKDSTRWGNYWNTNGVPKRVVETGSYEEWCKNNVYDIAGNISEWTQERYGSSLRVLRGGNYLDFGCVYPAAYRCNFGPFCCCNSTGFRVAIYVKRN